jgi:enoyl-CoA hydratase/carnithine racemase
MEHGLEIALCADIRICSTSTRFRCNDLYNGSAFPIDGGTQRLPRVIGTSWTMDMLLTGRIVDAQEALSIGLVNKVVKNDILENTTSELASLIASGATIANQYAKEAVYSGMEINLTDGLRLETDLNVILQSTYDRSEGIKSFLEKRPPIFKGE